MTYKIDKQDGRGMWLKSYKGIDGIYIPTRAGKLWWSIRQRCKVGGAEQRNNAAYRECTNDFKDFQTFAEWCQTQPGYRAVDAKGNVWHLDKDIVEPGNKSYCEEHCVFVPQWVNKLIIHRAACRGSYPLGVNFHKASGKVVAQCQVAGKETHLGLFHSPREAHAAWQSAKIEVLRKAAASPELSDSPAVVRGLTNRADAISANLLNGEETIF